MIGVSFALPQEVMACLMVVFLLAVCQCFIQEMTATGSHQQVLQSTSRGEASF